MFCDEIRRQAEAAPRAALPAVAAALWRAYGAGHVSEAEAEALSALIEARQAHAERHTPHDRQSGLRKALAGSRPRTDASMERRRRWAASGRLPPAIAARFTLAEQAVLALVSAETARRGDCRLSVPNLAAVAGVSETTVRNAIREARQLGLVTVEARPVTYWRNLPNIVRIVSAEWSAWLRLARKGSPQSSGRPSLSKGGGCKTPNRMPTFVSSPVDSGPSARSKRAAGSSGRPRPKRLVENPRGR